MVGLRKARETIDGAAAKVVAAAADTKQSIISLGVALALVAVVAFTALVVAMKARRAQA